MAESNAPLILKIALILAIVFNGIFGLVFLLAPEAYTAFTQAEVPDIARLRWPGSLLIALTVGAILVFRAPAGQGIFVFASALGALLAGLSLLFSLATGEYTGRTASMVGASIVILVQSGLLFLGWRSARDLLK